MTRLSHILLLPARAEWRELLLRGDTGPCPAWWVKLIQRPDSPISAVRAGLVEKWKAEREARLARGEKEEEEEEEEEINIYAVTEEEVLWAGGGGTGPHCLLLQATSKTGPWGNRWGGRKPQLTEERSGSKPSSLAGNSSSLPGRWV